jgi:1,4-dihydroxy-2-naphthoate octaprenyltransferase
MKKIAYWIEAMRLRTLPVSVAGVVAAAAFALWKGTFQAAPVLLCLIFAVLAQIASNFANEYFDYKAGLDKPGREGPRRGVTEGDITPRAMCIATFVTLALACLVGCSLLFWGDWWMIVVGIGIALGVLAYSAGPYPLSHHALGELSVVFFFGIIPVNLTYYLQAGSWDLDVFLASVGLGLVGSNVLIVNNYRDLEADLEVGKCTLAVAIGRHRISSIYLTNGWSCIALTMPLWSDFEMWKLVFPIVYGTIHTIMYFKVTNRRGSRLNPMLGMTAVMMLVYTLMMLVAVII